MGLSGISPLSLLLILAIIVALFGTSKLKTIGSDLGEAIKNFRKAMNSDETNDTQKDDNKPS
ncbi:TPA: twin-arginine translocase TatA/TatE family subunit [Legionella pneumophila]|nr:twin-arginine translocase TatA/TatE family subunit [Legionella pneumophila]HAT8182825.1 twin-arginine translocase TatA/TatE family subunit [Legionella pneumophila]